MKRVTHKPTRMPCERLDGKVSPHELRIRALLAADPNMHRNGFWTAVRNVLASVTAEWIAEGRIDDDGESWTDDIDLNRFLPDVYKVDYERRVIELYEVEGTSRLTENKLRRLVRLWNDFDCVIDDWEIVGFVVDTLGTPPRDLNLEKKWYGFLYADTASPTPCAAHRGGEV